MFKVYYVGTGGGCREFKSLTAAKRFCREYPDSQLFEIVGQYQLLCYVNMNGRVMLVRKPEGLNKASRYTAHRGRQMREFNRSLTHDSPAPGDPGAT